VARQRGGHELDHNLEMMHTNIMGLPRVLGRTGIEGKEPEIEVFLKKIGKSLSGGHATGEEEKRGTRRTRNCTPDPN